MSFKLIKKSPISQARLGILKVRPGKIETPFFMPVATQGAVKYISVEELKKLGAKIILANAYHLYLQPGVLSIKRGGGLHKFMGWPGAILTDSGGFQIFSLAGVKNKSGRSLVEIKKNGVIFKSHLDGKKHYLTPEKSFLIQRDLGVDIAVCLDECVALPADKEKLEQAVELTTRWAKKTMAYCRKIKGKKPLLFCVIQGGLDRELRQKSLRDLMAIGFSAKSGPASDWDGYNIGGLSVGETADEMYKVLDYLVPNMPEDKPRYLMGVGYPENILEAVKRGVDMFDCVIPTREGRHGRLFQMKSKKLKVKNFYYKLNIKNSFFARDYHYINPKSRLPELRNLSFAYLHHLFKINEPLGQRLASLINLEFYLALMAKIRQGIKEGEI